MSDLRASLRIDGLKHIDPQTFKHMLNFQCGIKIYQFQWDITKAVARKTALLLHISEWTEGISPGSGKCNNCHQHEYNTNCIPNCTL